MPATSGFRFLQHAFRITADDPAHLRAAERALAPFRAQVDGGTHYHLSDTRSGSSRYGLEVDGRNVWVSPHPGGTLDHLMWQVNDRLATGDRSHVLVHAGALVAPGGGALLLPASSGSGKTTTTLALVRGGYDYLSDEFAVLEPATLRVRAFARALSLKPGTQALLPDLAAKAVGPFGDGVSAYLPAEAVRPGSVAEGGEVRWVVFPRYDPETTPSLRRLRPAEVLVGLATNTFNLRGRYPAALPALRAVAERAAGWELRTNDLAATVALVDELTGR